MSISQFSRASICVPSVVGDKVNGVIVLAAKDLFCLVQLSVVRKLDSGMGFYRFFNGCKATVAGKEQTLSRTKIHRKLRADSVYNGFFVDVIAFPAINPFSYRIEGVLFIRIRNCDSLSYLDVCEDVFEDNLFREGVDIVINFRTVYNKSVATNKRKERFL